MPLLDDENPGIATVASVGTLFAEFLEEASSVKGTSTVEPALNKTDFADLRRRVSSALSAVGGSIVDRIAGQDAVPDANGAKPDPDALKAEADAAKMRQFAIVETAARDIFDDLIATTSIESPEFVKLWNLLDIVSILSDDEQCEPALLFWLVEELLDSQTIAGCRTIFDYLESRRDRITAKKFEQKKLVILRSCNELLRRLSRAEDTAFCGRVFIFMFQSFPLGDRSSVNLRGEYHVENLTTYETAVPGEDSKMVIDSQSDSQKDTTVPKTAGKGVSFDPKEPDKPLAAEALYPLFWSLQDNFSQPLKLFQQSNFADFKTNLTATVAKFESIPDDDESRSSRSAEESKHTLKRKRNKDGHETFAPKYLTSRDLFELEISDLSFRRHILVQALIILEFLLSLTPVGKKRLAAMPASNKSILYSDELSEEDAKWTVSTKDRIATYLRRGLDGPFFYRTVETVLARDKNWVIWKMGSCPPIQRDPVTPSTFTESKVAAQRMATHKRLRPMPMGAVSLDFLREDNEEAGMEKFKAEERYKLPELDDFKRKIADDDFEISMPTNEQTKAAAIAGRASKSWRALRIAGRFKLAAFDKIDDPQNIDAVFQEVNGLDEVEEDAEPVASDENMPKNREPLIVVDLESFGRSAAMVKMSEQHPGVFANVVRHTTRSQEEGEVNGQIFHFLKAQEFNQLRDGDKLIEHGTRDGHDYGTSNQAIQMVTDLGKVPIIELDVEAAQFAKDMGFDARYILLRPSGDEILQDRLERAGKDAADVQAAMDKFAEDLSDSKVSALFNKVLINDDLESSIQALNEFIFQKDEEAVVKDQDMSSD